MKEERRWFYAIIPLLIVACLRYGIGTDYFRYTIYFRAVVRATRWKMEWLFAFLSRIIMRTFHDTRVPFAFFSVIVIVLIALELRRNSYDYCESLFLFVTLGYYFGSLNIIRQYVAMAVVFYATRYIYEKRYLYFYIALFFAAGFHITVLVAAILPLLAGKSYSAKVYITIGIFALLIPVLRTPIINLLLLIVPQYSIYIYGNIQAVSLVEVVTNASMFLAFMLLGSRRLGKTDDPQFLLTFNCLFVSFLFYCISSFVPNINRISLYFEIYLIEYLPFLLSRNKTQSNKTNRILINAVCLFLFFFAIGYLGRYGSTPYRTFLS